MKNVGFVGVGVMGGGMVANMMAAGYKLRLYTRTKSKADWLLEKGAAWCASPRELAGECDVICTMVGFPKDVEDVYFGVDGIINNAKTGAMLIDFTTSRPDLAQRIHAEAAKVGLKALDAPVSGGDRGAREGTLSIMAGGAREDFEAALPLFEAIGKQIIYHGEAGSGQFCKMCNQIAIGGTMLGVCEAMAYAGRSGLDLAKVLDTISNGAADSWCLSNLAPRALKGDFQPGFYVKHIVKDLSIALESAHALGMDVPGLELATRLYRELEAEGSGDLGTQALVRRWLPKLGEHKL